jgi:polyketide cyclase/dehydrase/lipid transport protein
MFSFSLNAQVYRPIRQVFNFMTTPENDFQWQYGTLASAQVSDGQIGVGSIFRSIGHFMGRRIESTFEVTEYDPNRKYGFKTSSGPIQSETLYTFEMVGGSTRINISTHASPGDLFRMDDAIVEKKVKKQFKENLALLKGILEAR